MTDPNDNVLRDAPALAGDSAFLPAVRAEVGRVLIGQDALLDGMLIGLLADGHILLEGVPGLAKSLAVQALARALGGSFRRVQFTPDLLPSDLVGTQILAPDTGTWSVRKGPVFANFVLADEINRAPAKVQSALLEAMQERQVSLAGETFDLPAPFLVLATQNPVDQEGTYALPEAQVDRFLLKLIVDYPAKSDEIEIATRMANPADADPARSVQPVATPEQLLHARASLAQVHLDPKLVEYAVDIVRATRTPAEVGLASLGPRILYGASPRASIALTRAARARALLDGRGFVSPRDVRAVGLDVLRHRVLTTYEAEAEGLTSEQIIEQIFDAVTVP